MTTSPVARSSFWAGVRAILPLAAGVLPFGMAYGVAVAESSVSDWVGAAASPLILAGASQLALIELIDSEAPWLVAVATALFINARFVMYSGALSASFSEYPQRWRVPLVHLMTDQAATTSLLYNETERDPVRRRLFYAGAGLALLATWSTGTAIGIAFGASVPASWQLDFAVPLMFLALLIPALKDRPSALTAIVAAVVTVVARDAPYGSGLLIGASVGIAAGVVVRR